MITMIFVISDILDLQFDHIFIWPLSLCK